MVEAVMQRWMWGFVGEVDAFEVIVGGRFASGVELF